MRCGAPAAARRARARSPAASAKLSIIESFLENHKNKLDENDLQFCYLVRNMTVRELNAVKQGREELISAVEDNISEIRVLRDAES